MVQRSEIQLWAKAAPGISGELPGDRLAHEAFWRGAADLLRGLPRKRDRDAEQAALAEAILAAARAARLRFLRRHAAAIYDRLTGGHLRFLRLDELCRLAATEFPGLVPAPHELEAEACAPQRHKDGLEIDQGLFIAQVLADADAGAHLCHAMLLPREDSRARLAEFESSGEIDFGPVHLARHGRASVLTMKNPRFLNAEDETTLEAMEIAVDVALLDSRTELCVLRGGAIAHPSYAGRRVFGAGINLTHLVQGRIPLLWYLTRDLGYVNKLYRGLALAEVSPEEDGIEKLWVAAVDGFAIGGHCQILLAVDYTLAAEGAYLTLPARKEGIVPGAANLRLPRFVGDRIARQAVMAERRIECASEDGRLICDAIAHPDEMDAAIERTVASLTGSGVVSAAGNRRAFRAGQEPLDAYRRYMSVYAREQAYCHFSPALIRNLDQHWKAPPADR